MCALQVWSLCFPQSCGSPIIKPTGDQGQVPWEFPVPLSDPQAGKSDVGLRTFTTVRELLWYELFSSWWITHSVGIGFDFIMIVPLLTFHCSFFFVFGCGISFFLVGSSVLLSMVVQQLVVILALLQEMSVHPSTPPS